MPRRRPDSTARVRTPDPLVGYDFEIAAYEHRAIRIIHDAMHRQLAAGETAQATQTAVLMLDKLKTCWLTQSLNDFFDCFMTEEINVPDRDALEHLRRIDQTRKFDFNLEGVGLVFTDGPPESDAAPA